MYSMSALKTPKCISGFGILTVDFEHKGTINPVPLMLTFDMLWSGKDKIPANIYLFKLRNRNARKRCEICSKLTIKQQNEVNDLFWCFY